MSEVEPEEPWRFSVRDAFVALALGLGVAVFAWLSGNSSVFPPELWDAVAVAGGQRPPSLPSPGLWRMLSSLLFSQVGLARGVDVLRCAGPVVLGLAAALTFAFFAEILPLTSLRDWIGRRGWVRVVVNVVLAQGALVFVLSDPVWRAGRILSPDALLLVLFLAALILLLRSMRLASPGAALAFAAVSGLLSAETVFAFALPTAFVVMIGFGYGKNVDPAAPGLANPLIRLIAVRRMVMLFAVAWVGVVAANVVTFARADGLAAMDWTGFECVVRCLNSYRLELLSAATTLGRVLFVVVAAGPLALAFLFVGRETEEDLFLSYGGAVFFAAVWVLSLAQSGPWPSFWFWRWGGGASDLVAQGLPLCLCLLCTSATAMLAACACGIEFFFRNSRQIVQTRFQDAVEETPEAARAVESLRTGAVVARVALGIGPFAVLTVFAACKFASVEREMAELVNEGARQTAEECGEARLLFTDGSLDAAVEVAAAMAGRDLKVLSMMSGLTPWEKYVRVRGEEDEIEREALESGAANALRTWVRGKSERARDIALQVGFELWRRDRLPMPEMGGLVARTAGFAPGEAVRRADEAKALSARVLELYRSGRNPDKSPNSRLVSLFTFLQWRLARMCRMRADAADMAGDADGALAETTLADALDELNGPLAGLRRQMDWQSIGMNSHITLREGLELWLDRADFHTARSYAQRILQADPTDPRANFAMGMWYFVDEQYNRAEAYLSLSLERRPDVPAALNNLAVAQARLGRYAEAETNAVKALSLLPDAPEIKNTLNYIRARRSGR